jgi:hypothetical protein
MVLKIDRFVGKRIFHAGIFPDLRGKKVRASLSCPSRLSTKSVQARGRSQLEPLLSKKSHSLKADGGHAPGPVFSHPALCRSDGNNLAYGMSF